MLQMREVRCTEGKGAQTHGAGTWGILALPLTSSIHAHLVRGSPQALADPHCQCPSSSCNQTRFKMEMLCQDHGTYPLASEHASEY